MVTVRLLILSLFRNAPGCSVIVFEETTPLEQVVRLEGGLQDLQQRLWRGVRCRARRGDMISNAATGHLPNRVMP